MLRQILYLFVYVVNVLCDDHHDMNNMSSETPKVPADNSIVPDVLAFLSTLLVTAAIAVPCAIFVSRCQRTAALGPGPEYHRLKTTGGKANANQMLPMNDSISITLENNQVVTSCEAALTSEHGNEFTINGIKNNNDKRILKMLGKAKELTNHKALHTQNLIVTSLNNFPTGAGMASSASGCAAVALCLAKLFDLPLSDASLIARMGSGSACRSVYGGFVHWSAKSGASLQLFERSHWPTLKVIMLIHSQVPKHVSSRDGMASSVATSDLMKARVNCATERIEKLHEAIKHRDFETLAKITMQESNQLHAICLDTWPPLVYLNSTSYAIIRFVLFLNELANETITAYTFDAGPNGFLLVEEGNIPLLMTCLSRCFTLPDDEQIHGKDPTFLSNLASNFPEKARIDRVVVADIAEGPKVYTTS